MGFKNIKNLTPHVINLRGDFGKELIVEPSGIIARCEERIEPCEAIVLRHAINYERNERGNEFLNVPMIKKSLGEIKDLPEPIEGTIYITSLPVAQKAQRKDVFAIGESIRNEKGEVIGCKSLACFV